MPNPNLDENEVLRDVLSGLNEDVPPMPEGLHAAWMQQVEQAAEEKRTDRSLNRRAMTRFLSIAAAMVFVVGGTLLTRDELADRAAHDSGSAAVTQNAVPVEEAAVYDDTADSAVFTMNRSVTAGAGMDNGAAAKMTRGAEPVNQRSAGAPTEAKIIRTASLTIRTQDYDLSLTNLKSMCEAEGGWIEYSSESTHSSSGLRTVRLTLRIPQDALDGYLAGTTDCGRIVSRTEEARDVTASYQDTQAYLDTQLALMDRLLAMVPQAETLPDLLALEKQIADTQYNIDVLTATLADTDRQVAYATVTITLQEETAPALTDATVPLGERLLSGLRTGWEAILDFAQDMLVFLVAALPFIGVVAALAVILIIIRKAGRRKKE